VQPIALPVVCAVNESYVLPLAVMLESVKAHLGANYRPVLYLIHAGLPKGSLATISALVETHPLIPSPALLRTAPADSHFPPESSFLLLLPDLLPPHLERILFLDADTLVLEDLAKLWETPLEDFAVAAAADSAIPRCSSPRGVKNWQARGIAAESPYFNGGVMLIHLARWRERRVTPRVLEYLEATGAEVDFLHQEALNAVLWNDWKPLHPRWNLLGSLAGRAFEPTASAAWREPGIVHFAGRMKPWRVPIGGPFNAAYWRVLQRILPLIPRHPPTLRERMQSVYDRYLRFAAYPLERYLWKQRRL
jgi:lipopolysaccharide biosynthesis glycosyltransferase